MKWSAMSLLSAMVLSSAVMAQSGNSMGHVDVTTNMPAEVWSQGKQRQSVPNCSRCCLYENRGYSEGAVIKTDGVVLQCVRDRNTLSTQNLIWQVIK